MGGEPELTHRTGENLRLPEDGRRHHALDRDAAAATMRR